MLFYVKVIFFKLSRYLVLTLTLIGKVLTRIFTFTKPV